MGKNKNKILGDIHHKTYKNNKYKQKRQRIQKSKPKQSMSNYSKEKNNR